MDHGHPVKNEPDLAPTALPQPIMVQNTVQDTGSISDPPDHTRALTKVHLVAANDSPLLVNTGWLLLSNITKVSSPPPVEKVDLISLRKLVLLHYVAEGPTSRIFHVKDGADEVLLKLYHKMPARPVEFEAYEMIHEYETRQAQEEYNHDALTTGSHEQFMVCFEVDDVQIQQYGLTLEYLRAESLGEAARKIHVDSVSEFKRLLRPMMQTLHKTGIAHGNLAASNVLLDDPTRYTASLELKSMARSGVRPRLIGFSSAIFKKDVSDEEWAKAIHADSRKFGRIFALLKAQTDTNNAIKLAKRVTSDEKQETIRQRHLVRALKEADPFDNELCASVLEFSSPNLTLVLAVANHLQRGDKHHECLQWLLRFTDDFDKGSKPEFVEIHAQIAEMQDKVGESKETVESSWKHAQAIAVEALGMANPSTVTVRRKYCFWLMENADDTNGSAREFGTILENVMGYHKRGTGADMTEEGFLREMKDAVERMTRRMEKVDGPMVVTDRAVRGKVTKSGEEFVEFADKALADNAEKRARADELREYKATPKSARNALETDDRAAPHPQSRAAKRARSSTVETEAEAETPAPTPTPLPKRPKAVTSSGAIKPGGAKKAPAKKSG